MVASQMFLGTAATLIASSTAFVAPMAVRSVAPAAASSSTSFKMSATGADYAASLPGAPFGMAAEGKYFDPAGLATKQDPETIKTWREAELKHGRVAMLASLGILVSEVRSRRQQEFCRVSRMWHPISRRRRRCGRVKYHCPNPVFVQTTHVW